MMNVCAKFHENLTSSNLVVEKSLPTNKQTNHQTRLIAIPSCGGDNNNKVSVYGAVIITSKSHQRNECCDDRGGACWRLQSMTAFF